MARKESRTETMVRPTSPVSEPWRDASEIRLPPILSTDDVRSLIAEAAYYRAEKRGFEPGHELDDWLAAEADFMTRLPSTDVS
jgi:Protein of unknown function (DUF2934)